MKLRSKYDMFWKKKKSAKHSSGNDKGMEAKVSENCK